MDELTKIMRKTKISNRVDTIRSRVNILYQHEARLRKIQALKRRCIADLARIERQEARTEKCIQTAKTKIATLTEKAQAQAAMARLNGK